MLYQDRLIPLGSYTYTDMAQTGIKISSVDLPGLTGDFIYIRGRVGSFDNSISIRQYNTEEERDRAFDRYVICIENCNRHLTGIFSNE